MNPRSMTEGRQDKRKISRGCMRYTPGRHCCSLAVPAPEAQHKEAAEVRATAWAQSTGNQTWHSNAQHDFHFCYLSWLASNIFFLPSCHSHNPGRNFTIHGNSKILFTIPSIASGLPALSELPINTCFPILQNMEISSVSGKSFMFQTKTKIKNLLKQIPVFHRTPDFPGFAIYKTYISKTALEQSGLL